jgi:hypothetical protein
MRLKIGRRLSVLSMLASLVDDSVQVHTRFSAAVMMWWKMLARLLDRVACRSSTAGAAHNARYALTSPCPSACACRQAQLPTRQQAFGCAVDV